MSSPKTSTSSGAGAKLQRAINQLLNVEVIVRGMPKKMYKTKREVIEEITQEIRILQRKIERELLSKYER